MRRKSGEKRKERTGGGEVCLSPAQEVAAVVEGLPGQAKAHIEPKRLWVVGVEGPHQAGRRRHLLSNQLLRRRVAAGSSCCQGGRSLSVGHWLPLDEGGKLGGAIGLRKPQHLLVVTCHTAVS